MSRMIAIFEVEFDTETMCDEKSLKKEFGGSWLRLMKWLYKNESIGIFDEEFKLVAVRTAQSISKGEEK